MCRSDTSWSNVRHTKIFWSKRQTKTIQETGRSKRPDPQKFVYFNAHREYGPTEMKPCKYCNQQFDFKPLDNGKWMPVNAAGEPYKCTQYQQSRVGQ